MEQKLNTRQIVDLLENIDQLGYAREIIDKKIKDHYNQERILVWEVCDKGGFVTEFFKGDEYLKAVDCLTKECKEVINLYGKQDMEKGDNHNNMAFGIHPRYWLENEYKEYFEL